jgi:hypothetical protein
MTKPPNKRNMIFFIYKTSRKMRGDINSILTNNELNISIKKQPIKYF